ncbi:MAG: hypothetical protein JOZ81_31880 [Chloroflexi bacterium]|nr:hypothetical protein [Chloroflexota bacterium]
MASAQDNHQLTSVHEEDRTESRLEALISRGGKMYPHSTFLPGLAGRSQARTAQTEQVTEGDRDGLGRDQGRAPRVATSPLMIAFLGGLVLLAQALDLLSSLSMVLQYGVDAELNPLFRGILISIGPVGVAVVKLGVAAFVVSVLQALAWIGRPRLARNSLLIAVNIGVVGALSNGGFRFPPF